MAVRKLGACGTCSLWREATGAMAAYAKNGPPPSGECRRRLHISRVTRKPAQPRTPPDGTCAEHLPLPAPERLPSMCAECRYWRRLEQTEGGECRVWAPQHGKVTPVAGAPDAIVSFVFPVTEASFVCGDGVSVKYTDPDELPNTT